MPDLSLTDLDDLAVLGVRGADAVFFLQGQLSQDVSLLSGRGAQIAGLHNPQGRCLAVLRLINLADDHILVVLPAGLADSVRQLLSRYVLRARVKIEDANSTWRVYGVTGPDASAVASTRLATPMDPDGLRQLVIAPRGEPLPQGEPARRAEWRLDDISAGLPEIVAATSGMFVAQMLNLDLLEAISFEKGCYTGQEVIARAHYRGQVKRRMQRFQTGSTTRLAPGERISLSDGRRAQVVIAAALEEEGRGQEFLAVTTMPGSTLPDEVEEQEATAQRMQAVQLPLPYQF
jgi:folate-binding protein YgfZ